MAWDHKIHVPKLAQGTKLFFLILVAKQQRLLPSNTNKRDVVFSMARVIIRNWEPRVNKQENLIIVTN